MATAATKAVPLRSIRARAMMTLRAEQAAVLAATIHHAAQIRLAGLPSPVGAHAVTGKRHIATVT